MPTVNFAAGLMLHHDVASLNLADGAALQASGRRMVRKIDGQIELFDFFMIVRFICLNLNFETKKNLMHSPCVGHLTARCNLRQSSV